MPIGLAQRYVLICIHATITQRLVIEDPARSNLCTDIRRKRHGVYGAPAVHRKCGARSGHDVSVGTLRPNRERSRY